MRVLTPDTQTFNASMSAVASVKDVGDIAN